MDRVRCLPAARLLLAAMLLSLGGEPAWLPGGRMASAGDLEPLRYQHAGLQVDLGVGLYAYPLPMDFDGDGDLDLVLSCPDKPYNGTYFFENPAEASSKHPVFRAARRISRGLPNVQVSRVGREVRVVGPGQEYPDFLRTGLELPRPWNMPAGFHQPVGTRTPKQRSNQWQHIDFDGDGDHDLIAGIDDWSDYGWDDAFNERGEWTHGPLHGYVYLALNETNNVAPRYGVPKRLQTSDERDIDVYGWPSPCVQDFDGDGDLDLLCGEFLDGFTYFENRGSRQRPSLAPGKRLARDGRPLKMDLQMILPVAIDWDADGDMDLVVGDEDGRVALIEHSGRVADGMPVFLDPHYFRQEADRLKCGALATPAGFDWDGDGDEDLLSGNTAGYLEWFENLGPPSAAESASGSVPTAAQEFTTPRFAAPRRLEADGAVIRVQAGPNGSIQGPCEAKWGYTILSVADWDHDGLPDLVVNSIWGRIQWYRNIGTRSEPRLANAADVTVAWPDTPPKPAWNWWNPDPGQLVTQWRTRPVVVDWNRDGLNDLVMLDHEGYLAWFERRRDNGQLILQPGRRIFHDQQGQILRLNARQAGGSGRRTLALCDWDQDGLLDLLVDGKNVEWYRQLPESTTDRVLLAHQGSLANRELAAHATCPTIVDWNRNGVPDLLVGAEDGHFYYLGR